MQRGFVGPTEACIVQMQEHIANYGIAEYTETLCETGPKVLGLYSAELSTLNALMFLVILFLSFRMKKLLSF